MLGVLVGLSDCRWMRRGSGGGGMEGGYRAGRVQRGYFPTDSTPPDNVDGPSGDGEGEGCGREGQQATAGENPAREG